VEDKPNRSAWTKGQSAPCEPQPAATARPLRLVLLGAPGVGKGTQAELLAAHSGACQLSTGDVFRAAKTLAPSDRTPSLSEALEFMKRGELVPDGTVLAMVKERVACLRCHGGFLLDGFPRTVTQAQALDELLVEERIPLDAVLSLDMPIERIVARLAGRRTCSSCKAVYHVEMRPPKTAGQCDHCGAELLHRDDDRPEAVRVRMETYEQRTAPLIDYYSRQGLLASVSAEGTPEEIFGRTIAALEARQLATAGN
jgi:adenylate kinase